MQLQVLDLDPLPSRARTISASCASPPDEPHGGRLGRAGRPPPRSATAPLFIRSSSPGSPGMASTLGRPISALSASGVPWATIWPWSMMPDPVREHSASSRYCVVRKTVTPRSAASRWTSAQSALRLCGSSPVVGSSRNRMRGPCTSASARSSRRFMPPEYPPILRSAASVRPTRSSSASPALARARAAHAVQRGLQPHVLAPGQERVERGLLECGPDRGAHRRALARRRRARSARACLRWAAAAWSACGRWWSCRPRSGRGTRRSRRAPRQVHPIDGMGPS